MKRILLAATALVMMTGAAAATSRQLVASGYWSTHIVDRSSDGTPMCMMRATWTAPGGAEGRVFVKYANGEVFFHIFKTNWRFDADVEVPLTVTFDSGVRKATGVTVNTNGHHMIEIAVQKEHAGGILSDFAESNVMAINFESGNEPTWNANMYGSRLAAQWFIRCIKHIGGGGTATSPVGPQASSPVGPPKSSAKPTTPVGGARKADNGSI
jgi:hypothetical protein